MFFNVVGADLWFILQNLLLTISDFNFMIKFFNYTNCKFFFYFNCRFSVTNFKNIIKNCVFVNYLK